MKNILRTTVRQSVDGSTYFLSTYFEIFVINNVEKRLEEAAAANEAVSGPESGKVNMPMTFN